MVNYNSYKSITNSISYCQHTNIKIGMSNHFHNVRGISMKGEHPIFNAPASQLEDMILRHEQLRLTVTEQYLVCVAYLVNTGTIDTSKCGLHLTSSQFNDSKIIILLPKLFHLLRQHASSPHIIADKDDFADLPVYAVSEFNQCDGGQLKIFIKGFIKLLERYYSFDGIMRAPTQSSESDMLLRDELTRIENGYNDTLPTRVIKKKFLKLAEDSANSQQLAIIKKTLFTNSYHKFTEQDYTRISDWITENVDTFEVERYQHIKRLIVRYYDYAVSVINDISLDVSFDIEPQVKATATTKASTNSIDKAAKGSALSALAKFMPSKVSYINR